jgi:hypothetical protein
MSRRHTHSKFARVDRDVNNSQTIRDVGLSDAVPARPQFGVEVDLKPSEGGYVDPCLTVDGPAERAVADISDASNFAQSSFVGNGLQVQRELTGDFGDGVGAASRGPGGAELLWPEPSGTRHRQSIEVADPIVLGPRWNKTPSRLRSGVSNHHNVWAVALRIQEFNPMMPADDWAAIGTFVRSIVTDVQPHTPYRATSLLGTLSQYARWTWMAGNPLDRQTVFARWLIEDFIANGCPRTWSASTRGNHRSRLFRMSEALFGPDAQTPLIAALPGSQPSTPYTPSELVTFRSWASGQATTQRRHDATVLLALAAGAGIGNADLANLRRKHITEADGGIDITIIGNRPRTVTVLAEWERDVRAAIENLEPEMLVFGENRWAPSKNAVNNFISKTSGQHKPNSQRLRATWIVHHLTANTPIKALMAAAGLNSFESFNRLIGFVPSPSPLLSRQLLRGNTAG